MSNHPVWDMLLPPSEYGSPRSLVLRAHGHRLTFAEGGDVLDATSGLWNVNLGYGNEAIADAIGQALRDASYLTLFRYHHTYAHAAASALLDLAGPGRYRRVLFSTSGSAANDAAMKLARQYHVLRGEPGRRLVVGFHGSYHGQTYGSFAITGQDLGQPMYGVDTSLVRHVDHTDPGELSALLAESGADVAAVVIEPVLGFGALTVPDDMIAGLLALRREHGFLLVCDEVATGFGRTGTMFASDRWPESPDLLLASKGLTNGTCAAAAILVNHAVCAEFERANAVFVHGETQAGTPPTCAAIVATRQQFDELDAIASGRRTAARLAAGLDAIAAASPIVAGATGTGCFRALHLRRRSGAPLPDPHVRRVIAAIRNRGALVHPGPSAIQVVPALTYSAAEADELLTAIDAGLSDYAARGRFGEAPSSVPVALVERGS